MKLLLPLPTIGILCLLFLFSSCDPTRKITSSVKPTEITDLQLFRPISYITLIDAGNRPFYNDSLSKKSQHLIKKSLRSNQEPLPLTDDIHIEDTSLQNKLDVEAVRLMIRAFNHKKKDSLHIPPLIDSVLDARGKRYGLIIFAEGFARTSDNYTNQTMKGIGIGILTLGSYYTVPNKSGSTFHAMIVDAQNNNVAFYRFITEIEWHPLNEKVVKTQLFRLFNGYFYKVYVQQ